MNITWFGHSCFRVEFGASRILIDPFLTGNPTFEKAG
ncbi:MAG TPA: metal-dependent hydrolase, partial [Methyloceanibacter sp.]|nr:metal-dependent hydrolase [Methyloceanibacter sp.]